MLFSLHQKSVNPVVKSSSHLEVSSSAKYTSVCCLWDDSSEFLKLLAIFFIIIIVLHISWFWLGNMARKASWTTLPVLVVANKVFLIEEELRDGTENLDLSFGPYPFLWVCLQNNADNACSQMYSRSRSGRSSFLSIVFQIAGASVC